MADIPESTSTTPAGQEVERIPAGMKPWHGGESAPADWDASQDVLLSTGYLAPLKAGLNEYWKRKSDSRGDILARVVAYTPLATPSVATPADDAGVRDISTAMLGEVMQDAWSEICDDAGAHPSDMKHGRGSVLFYSPGHWTDLIALRLNERIAASPKVPSVAIGAGEVERLQTLYGEHKAWPANEYPPNGGTDEEWEPFYRANRARAALLEAIPALLAALAPASASIPADVEREANHFANAGNMADEALLNAATVALGNLMNCRIDAETGESRERRIANLLAAERRLRATLAARPSTVERDNDGQKGGGE